jgi:hypothetical protein
MRVKDPPILSSGSYVSNHELVLKHPDTLLFDLYYDDYEIANPIGSHRLLFVYI